MIPVPSKPNTDQSLLIPGSEEVTSSWLSAVLKTPATVLDVSPIGTGQMSKTVRVKFELDEARGEVESVVVKIQSESEASQAMGFGGAYENESRFYADFGEEVARTGSLPHCYLAVYLPKGIFTLVMEDLKDHVQGDQLKGCGPEDAAIALSALAKIQAPFLANYDYPTKYPWLLHEKSTFNADKVYRATFEIFLERYKDLVTPEHAELVRWVEPRMKRWRAEPKDSVFGFKHRDYRLDNILFPKDPSKSDRVVVVDYQGAAWGLAMEDASYFMGSSLIPADRRKYEKDLIKAYVAELNGKGQEKLDWATAWWQYRRSAIFGITQAVYAAVLCVRTPRGDIMFTTLLRRHAEHCLDLNVMELFP